MQTTRITVGQRIAVVVLNVVIHRVPLLISSPRSLQSTRAVHHLHRTPPLGPSAQLAQLGAHVTDHEQQAQPDRAIQRDGETTSAARCQS